jgi:exodeoxyribonuclease VII large subunit
MAGDNQSDTAGNAPEFSVSEIAHALKRTVEDSFGHVRVRGELSGVKRAASGHLYLALKDENAVLDGVMWKGQAGVLRFRPEDGLEVIVTGKLTTYPGRSKYQIVIERMEPAGAGALMALLEARKVKLAAEGLFDAARKRPLPYLPEVIAVVSSPTGAVIRDILHRLEDRFPRHVILWPVLVQGEAAADQISAAVRGFNAGGVFPRPDLIIVARGGGSIEDLWAFNEEAVVRAVADSDIPVISAVGHETDTTLCDFAADRRAPTPTAAAEMAVPVRSELQLTATELGLRMARAATRASQARAERLAALAARLPTPQALLGLKRQRSDDLGFRLPRALQANVEIQRRHFATSASALRPALLGGRLTLGQERLGRAAERLIAGREQLVPPRALSLTQASRLLDTLSYKATLRRGYAVVRTRAGVYVKGAAQASGALRIIFTDGEVEVNAGTAPKSSRSAPAAVQGELL